MRILEINSVPYGSTAKIMLGVAEACAAKGHDVLMSCGYSYHPIKELQGNYVQIGTALSKQLHIWGTLVTGMHGCFSGITTRLFLRKVKKFCPDVVHLHNIHSGYINIPLLFKYLKKHSIRRLVRLQ